MSLRQMARERGLYPTPLTPAFIVHSACWIATYDDRREYEEYFTEFYFKETIFRLDDPTIGVDGWAHLDRRLAKHGIVPWPSLFPGSSLPSPELQQKIFEIRQIRGVPKKSREAREQAQMIETGMRRLGEL
jgi:hypothetical protein